METFWICSECGSTNLYPDITECEVCSKQIDEQEKKQAKNSLREAQKSKEQFIRYERKEARRRKRQAFEQSVREWLEQKRLKKQAKLQKSKRKKFNQILKNEESFFDAFGKFLKPVKTCLVVLVVFSVFIVGVSVVRQDSSQVIKMEVNTIAESAIVEFVDGHFYMDETDDLFFKPFQKIKDQQGYLKQHFSESKSIEFLIKSLGW